MAATLRVRFLEPHEAWVRLRAASFWSTVQLAELRERYGSDIQTREQAWEHLRDGFTPFTLTEKQHLRHVAEEATRLWQRCFGTAPPATVVAVGRWPSRWDWGYPYTVSDMIVVPEHMASRMSPRTFLHETLHIWQRAHPDLFRTAYASIWEFRYVPDGLQVPETVRSQWVSNPDGWDNHHWIWTDPKTRRPWCLVCVLEGARPVPRSRAVAVDLSTGSLDPARGVLEEDELMTLLGRLSQLYHPHEILAKHLEQWLDGNAPVPTTWKQVFRTLTMTRSKVTS